MPYPREWKIAITTAKHLGFWRLYYFALDSCVVCHKIHTFSGCDKPGEYLVSDYISHQRIFLLIQAELFLGDSSSACATIIHRTMQRKLISTQSYGTAVLLKGRTARTLHLSSEVLQYIMCCCIWREISRCQPLQATREKLAAGALKLILISSHIIVLLLYSLNMIPTIS